MWNSTNVSVYTSSFRILWADGISAAPSVSLDKIGFGSTHHIPVHIHVVTYVYKFYFRESLRVRQSVKLMFYVTNPVPLNPILSILGPFRLTSFAIQYGDTAQVPDCIFAWKPHIWRASEVCRNRKRPPPPPTHTHTHTPRPWVSLSEAWSGLHVAYSAWQVGRQQ